MRSRASRQNTLKIVVFGPYHVGKSSFIQSIDPNARHIEARTSDRDQTTVAIDFGRTVIEDCRVFLFGTPGQERFEFVRRWITCNLDGALLLVDEASGLQTMHREIRDRMRQKGVPVAYLINKHDISVESGSLQMLGKDEFIQTISALDPVSSRRALVSFVQSIIGPHSS